MQTDKMPDIRFEIVNKEDEPIASFGHWHFADGMRLEIIAAALVSASAAFNKLKTGNHVKFRVPHSPDVMTGRGRLTKNDDGSVQIERDVLTLAHDPVIYQIWSKASALLERDERFRSDHVTPTDGTETDDLCTLDEVISHHWNDRDLSTREKMTEFALSQLASPGGLEVEWDGKGIVFGKSATRTKMLMEAVAKQLLIASPSGSSPLFWLTNSGPARPQLKKLLWSARDFAQAAKGGRLYFPPAANWLRRRVTVPDKLRKIIRMEGGGLVAESRLETENDPEKTQQLSEQIHSLRPDQFVFLRRDADALIDEVKAMAVDTRWSHVYLVRFYPADIPAGKLTRRKDAIDRHMWREWEKTISFLWWCTQFGPWKQILNPQGKPSWWKVPTAQALTQLSVNARAETGITADDLSGPFGKKLTNVKVGERIPDTRLAVMIGKSTRSIRKARSRAR